MFHHLLKHHELSYMYIKLGCTLSSYFIVFEDIYAEEAFSYYENKKWIFDQYCINFTHHTPLSNLRLYVTSVGLK